MSHKTYRVNKCKVCGKKLPKYFKTYCSEKCRFEAYRTDKFPKWRCPRCGKLKKLDYCPIRTPIGQKRRIIRCICGYEH